ncbi:DMT family transporter [Gemelliphila palaticanis]|uniref:DMT family transporter n=1 Tax=Gemelliphila palaticanis TaxID=81950 RepID=A0ABX2SZT1_9BACL|nr:DMT family transporter [Gemella palaticanis]MBF0714927.1 DMT family transporter [Gemella palaticanis]NYS46857.1 DMT family transporter [Gemella palaticanis]
MKKNNLFLGILCILISGLAFSIMGVFVKLSGDLPVIQKSFFRNIIACLITIIPIWMHYKKIIYPSNKQQWTVLFLRAFFGTVGLILNFYAISNISLSDATVIQRLSPFIVLILSYFIFKEKLTVSQLLAIIIAFLGIILIIKPSLENIISLGAFAALLGAFFAGGAYASLRYLGISGVSSEFIVFFFSIFSSLSLLPFVIINFAPMSANQLIMLIVVGITGAIGQFGITYAYKFTAAKNLSVFDYGQIIFAGFLGYIFFSEIPDFYSIIGYLTIVLMGLYVSYKR